VFHSCPICPALDESTWQGRAPGKDGEDVVLHAWMRLAVIPLSNPELAGSGLTHVGSNRAIATMDETTDQGRTTRQRQQQLRPAQRHTRLLAKGFAIMTGLRSSVPHGGSSNPQLMNVGGMHQAFADLTATLRCHIDVQQDSSTDLCG
jgi:hypothetical protein